MKSILSVRNILPALALSCLASASVLGAESKPASTDPQVNALLTRHLEAVGGAGELQKITSRQITGTLERHGTKVPFIRTQKVPNRLLFETRFPKPGSLIQGFDGSMAWIQHPLQGVRRLEGKQHAALADEAWLHPVLHLRDQYPVRLFLGERIVKGRKLIAISMARKKLDRPEVWFFAETTTLLARVERKVDGGVHGEIPVIIVFEDYRKVNGVMIPFTVHTKLPTSDTVLHIDTVEQNLPLDDAIFKAPL